MATFDTAKEYASRGIHVRTVCPPGSRLEKRLLEAQLLTLPLKARKYFDPSCIRRIRRALDEDAITSVVLHQLKDIWHVRPALVCRPRVKLIGFAHIMLSVNKRDPMHAWLYGRMDALICLTEIQKRNFAESLPIDPRRLPVIPNAVDTRRFHPACRSEETRRSLGAESDEFLIGVIGRLDEFKGQMETIEAARRLKDAGFRFKVVLVGEDTLNLQGTRARLEKKMRELAVEDCVRLTGYRSDIPEIIASLDILAMPSWAETFGRVLIEAMASRTAVVSTRSGGVPDIIDDNLTGLLVPPRESGPLADAFQRLLSDQSLRERLRENGYRKALEVYELTTVQRETDRVLLQERA